MKIKFILFLLIFPVLLFAEETEQKPKLPDFLNLEYIYSTNDTIKYAISQHITGTQSNPGQKIKHIDIELSAIIRLECIKLYEDGSCDLQVNTENATMKSDGKLVDGYTATKDIFIMPFNKQGSMNMVSLDFASIESMPFMLLLPEKPIPSSDVWTIDIPLKNSWPSRVHLEQKAISEMNGIYTINQKISTSSGMKKKSDTTELPNLQEGSGIIEFDKQKGRIISAKGLIKSSISTLTVRTSKNEKANLKDRMATTKLECTYKLAYIDSTDKK